MTTLSRGMKPGLILAMTLLCVLAGGQAEGVSLDKANVSLQQREGETAADVVIAMDSPDSNLSHTVFSVSAHKYEDLDADCVYDTVCETAPIKVSDNQAGVDEDSRLGIMRVRVGDFGGDASAQLLLVVVAANGQTYSAALSNTSDTNGCAPRTHDTESSLWGWLDKLIERLRDIPNRIRDGHDVTQYGYEYCVGVARLDTTESRQMPQLEDIFCRNVIVDTPRWSPDGNRLVFSVADSAGSSIVAMRLSDREITTVASGGCEKDPFFVNAGESIVYRTENEIRSIDLKSMRTRTIARVPGIERILCVSTFSDTDEIVFERPDEFAGDVSQLFSLRLNQDTAETMPALRQIVYHRAWQLLPAISPNSPELLVADGSELSIVSIDKETRISGDEGGWEYGSTSWSRDGSCIAYVRRRQL